MRQTRPNPQPADVFSLAKTLWTLATGQEYPLPGEYRLEESAYQLASFVASERTSPLDRLIERCTRIDPARRPVMADVAAELDAWLLPAPEQHVRADLTTVAERIRRLSEPTHRSEQLNERQERDVTDSLETLSAVLNELRPALEHALVHVHFHRDLGFLERWNAWATPERARRTGEVCLHARTPGPDPIAIVFAIGLQWLGNERLSLAAGVGIEDEYAGPLSSGQPLGTRRSGRRCSTARCGGSGMGWQNTSSRH